MNKPMNVYLVVTVLIGMAIECFVAFHVVVAIWRGLNLLLEWLCNHINPVVGILTIIGMFFVFMAYDSANSIEFAELEELEEDE